MDKIGKVTLGMNPEAEVIVKTAMKMNGPDDKDDLYFTMFNIMAEPLRMVVAVVGDFSGLLPQYGYESEDIEEWVASEPEKYLSLVMKHYADLMAHAEEKISIPLESKENAEKARVVLSSLIAKGFYIQTTNYVIPDGENDERSQQVPTAELVDDLRVMLDIVKQWDTFDLQAYLKKMGATI